MTTSMVQVLVAVVIVCAAVAALIVLELVQRRRGGRGLPVLRTLPTRRLRARHV